jgi:lambda repressor-like predicted transcriptional regulator
MKKDFNVKITVRNNHLLSAVMDKFGSGAELCRQCGVPPAKLAAYMTMRESPVGVSGWKQNAITIATALNVYPSDLWPKHMEDVRLKSATAEVEMDAKEVQEIIAGGYEVDQVAMSDLLGKITSDLSPRQKDFMQWRLLYGEDATLKECGEALGVSVERARQIQHSSMHKMRLRAKKLGVESMSELTI